MFLTKHRKLFLKIHYVKFQSQSSLSKLLPRS